MLIDLERRWAPAGICREEEDDLFFAKGPGNPNRSPTGATQNLWDQAKDICAQCPVLAECRRDTLGETHGVWGGRDEHERYLLRRKLPGTMRRMPEEQRQAWAKFIHGLRTVSLWSWSEIRLATGIPVGVGEALVTLWEVTLQERAQGVVDLPLPEPMGMTLPTWPEQPGRRHGWVRNGAIFADAHYMGQTADGRWLRMKSFSGRGSVIKWHRAEHVRLYRPQPVYIIEYKGRPSEPEPDREGATVALTA